MVENALNHGLRNKRGEKRILIQAGVLGDALEIAVEDNGVGMDEEKLSHILGEGDKSGEGKSTSIGLANIRGRIQILYGEKAAMEIQSREGEGTRISLRIPRMKLEEVKLWI